MNTNGKSTVYITGAGPGDPWLLTLKAKDIFKKADVIVYDNLVSEEILQLALFLNPSVKLIYVGKIGGEKEKSFTQEEINNLLVKLSKEYKTICRLKGGDPNVFGRGGEEAEFLAKNNIAFEFIPGISSIAAVPAYSGIPLTHRSCTSSFTVLTAHEDPNNLSSSINWNNFDAKNNTLVLLMGVKQLPKILNRLISLGRDKNTPVAIIYSGTTSKQETIITNIENAMLDIQKTDIKTPSLIIVGKVVDYRQVLNWFETKPLFGKRILVTREREKSILFASKLISLGMKPVLCPLVSYEFNESEIYNKDIINNLSQFDWIFFTSQNAVRFFFEILKKNCYDSRALAKTQIAVVGYKTKQELEKYNLKADFIPKKFSLESLLNELGELQDLTCKKILHPTQIGTIGRESLHNIITWEIYKANFIDALDETIIKEFKQGIDIVTFFSSDTARHFKQLIQTQIGAAGQLPLLAAIGEETAKTVKELFGNVDVISEIATEDALIEALEKYFIVDTFNSLSLRVK